MPTSAPCKAGASLTPSPVTATSSRFFFSALTMRIFCSEDAREHDLRGVERELELDVREMLESFAGDHDGRGGAHQSDLAGNRRRGVRMIARDHDHLDAGVSAFLECAATSGRWIFKADESGKGHLRFRFASSKSSGNSRQAKARTRKPFRQPRRGAERDGQVSRVRAPPSIAARAHRASTTSGAPLQ